MVSVKHFWRRRVAHWAKFKVVATVPVLALLAFGLAALMTLSFAVSTFPGQATTSDKPKQEVKFKILRQALGHTKDGYMLTDDKYAASDGNTLYVTILYLRSPENAKKRFEGIVSSASETIEQQEVHDEKSGVYLRRAVLSVPDTSGHGGKQILILAHSDSQLYEFTSSSLDDVLEYERQKMKVEVEARLRKCGESQECDR